jgi:hypothetical protein
MLAATLLECAGHVRILGTIHYEVAGGLTTPYVTRSAGVPPAVDAASRRGGRETRPDQQPGRLRSELFPFFDVERTPIGVFEYWLVISEILASPAWHVTKLIADHDEYDQALNRMKSPQIVRAIPPPMLPDAELREDGTALLDVTVYTLAGEERIERRTLALDRDNELRFHGRVLLAEGRGGVDV